jgi:hypothetical protein
MAVCATSVATERLTATMNAAARTAVSVFAITASSFRLGQ